MDELIPAFRQSIFNDSLADGVANIAEVGIDSIMSDGLLKDIPIVNLLLNASRTFKAIHERNLLKNTALFLDAVNSQKIDDKKVQAYKKKLLNEKTAERELGRVIVLLDQYVDNIKAQMLGKLFCQYSQVLFHSSRRLYQHLHLTIHTFYQNNNPYSCQRISYVR